MVLFNDIYSRINSGLVSHKYWEQDVNGKKMILDLELKNYIISKIQEMNLYNMLSNVSYEKLSVSNLISILAANIPREQHDCTLNHFIHYILQVAGSLQNWAITWWCEENEDLIENPIIDFNEVGVWDKITTHIDTDYVKAFNFVYEVFINRFLTSKDYKRILIKGNNADKKAIKSL